MNYNYEERKIKIVTWLLVALLTISVIGASLLFILSSRTPSTRLNTVDVGSRITGRGFKSTLTNADVWDGTTATNWTGSGTKTDPYLISSAKQLAGISAGTTSQYMYNGKYFKLTKDIDLNNKTFQIGSVSKWFTGYFDGDGHTIANVVGTLFYRICTPTTNTNTSYEVGVANLNIIFNDTATSLSSTTTYFGILTREAYSYYQKLVFDNVNIELPKILKSNVQYANIAISPSSNNYNIGGMFGTVRSYVKSNPASVTNCSVTSGLIQLYSPSSSTSVTNYNGGLAAFAQYVTFDKCQVTTKFMVSQPFNCYIGGLIGYACSCTLTECYSAGEMDCNNTNSCDVGGLIGRSSASTLSNCLRQGKLYGRRSSSAGNNADRVGGLIGYAVNSSGTADTNPSLTNCIFNGYFYSSNAESFAGGLCASVNVSGKNAYNTKQFNQSSYSYRLYTAGATTDANMKLRSTFSTWSNFDTYWTIDANINDGYPMLTKFLPIALVTGFDGDGSFSSPYLIKTQQDLLGVASYYNDNPATQPNLFWKVVNDIDVSVNANNVLIHFEPICYAKEFDGYLDGNNKTISGLLVDNQYAYTGLFGTIASGSYVKNLTVKGNIYWDQAYAVGGVAGRVLAGGYIQNCSFTGNIIGVLNTKSSTECSGVVGTYEINGANDCSATYADLKYAKISGTTASPTYTYYLYDWARITTNLYNKKV